MKVAQYMRAVEEARQEAAADAKEDVEATAKAVNDLDTIRKALEVT
jgi:hypothetical protein